MNPCTVSLLDSMQPEICVAFDRGIAWQSDRSSIVPYDSDYWNKYRSYRGTPIARRINAARVELSHRYATRGILDIGIGSGEFLDYCRLPAWGFDVNPVAVAWLHEVGLFAEPVPAETDGVSMWDVLEHLPDPAAILAKVPDWLFLCLPIFDDLTKIRESKHYKPNEHLWYFTDRGLVSFVEECGFRLVEANDAETDAGREAIRSYAFRRVAPATPADDH